MSGEVYWLASYPKSGNTWTRVLLTNYLRDRDEPADISNLSGGPIASARSVFDDNVGLKASDLTQDEIERLRPGVYEVLSREHALAVARGEDVDPPFLKVHDAYTYTVDGVPMLSKAATAGVIHLVRDPRDVAESFAHHRARSVAATVASMNDDDFAFVDKKSKLHNQLRQRLLTWSRHVSSWIDEPGLRVLTVRYEDMVDDTGAALTKMLAFSGIDPDPDRVAKAVDFSRFDRLQAQEAEDGFGERMPKAESFFRQGKARAWEGSLAPELVEEIEVAHGDVMRRLGYL